MNDNGKPKAPVEVKIQDVIALTARLAQLLAEEVDLLGDMKVSKIEALQQEKLFLVGALDVQRRMLDKHPHLLDAIPSQEKLHLKEVVEVFNRILKENHRKLLLAKEVNHKIVQAITDVVRQSTRSRVYNGKGSTPAGAFGTLSVTLNRMI